MEVAAQLAQVFDLSKYRFKRVPENLRAGRPGKLRHDRDLEDTLRDAAGLSRSEAKVAASAARAATLRDAGVKDEKMYQEITALLA